MRTSPDVSYDRGVATPVPACKAILSTRAERDETAAMCHDADGNPEPDPELRDTEVVPLAESIEAYFEREVHQEGRTMTRRIFLDTEWTAAPWSGHAELMWIGLADEDGRGWYGISSEVEIDPSTNAFVSGAFRLISQHEQRLSRAHLAEAVLSFCGKVDEFWVWVPTLESFALWSGLGDQAPDVHAKYRDVDLQMLRALVRPWPDGWPTEIHDLNAAALAAGVPIPPRPANHLHPRVHAEWNRQLFALIHSAQNR